MGSENAQKSVTTVKELARVRVFKSPNTLFSGHAAQGVPEPGSRQRGKHQARTEAAGMQSRFATCPAGIQMLLFQLPLQGLVQRLVQRLVQGLFSMQPSQAEHDRLLA